MTLICVPTENDIGLYSEMSAHFGKTSYFVFAEVEEDMVKNYEVKKCLGRHEGGTKTPAEIIAESGANILICGGLGSKAVLILTQRGITIFSGASGTVEDVIKQWKLGKLSLADGSSCPEDN
jgi:predicted Fe-Mo cluster-binding NifX family protein